MPREKLAPTLLLLAALHASSTFATEFNGGQGEFSDPTQWTPQVVPGPGDTALFDHSGYVAFNHDATTLNAIVSAPTNFLIYSGVIFGDEVPAPLVPHTYTL